MLFNTVSYLIFFLVVFTVSLVLRRVIRLRRLFLLGASLFFYGSWDARFIFLLLFSIVLNYVCGWGIWRLDKREGPRKAVLIFSLVGNLGLLFFFKYFDFFLQIVNDVLNLTLGQRPFSYWDILLPVGLSFFTFQTMSYTIDIYRRKMEPTLNPFDFALFVSFFPQLVAGPIVRAIEFLPQLKQEHQVTEEEAGEAIWLIGVGLLKKLVFADYVGANLVDRVFDFPEQFSAVETLFALYGYTLQIFCDFSGYSDVAIGSALLLGIRLPQNFDYPYKATSVSDFWRRWHQSLSRWIRDYLYYPLGGSRGKTRFFTYRNIFLTMVIMGLWHGANYTFLVYGIMHASYMILDREFGYTRRLRLPALQILVTFHLVAVTRILFRAPDIEIAWRVTERFWSGTYHAVNLHWEVLVIMALGFLIHYLPEDWARRTQHGFVHAPAAVQGAALAGVMVLLRVVATSEVQAFIYYQF